MEFNQAKEILTFSGYKFDESDDSVLRKLLDWNSKYGENTLESLSDDEFKSEFEKFKADYVGNEEGFNESRRKDSNPSKKQILDWEEFDDDIVDNMGGNGSDEDYDLDEASKKDSNDYSESHADLEGNIYYSLDDKDLQLDEESSSDEGVEYWVQYAESSDPELAKHFKNKKELNNFIFNTIKSWNLEGEDLVDENTPEVYKEAEKFYNTKQWIDTGIVYAMISQLGADWEAEGLNEYAETMGDDENTIYSDSHYIEEADDMEWDDENFPGPKKESGVEVHIDGDPKVELDEYAETHQDQEGNIYNTLEENELEESEMPYDDSIEGAEEMVYEDLSKQDYGDYSEEESLIGKKVRLTGATDLDAPDGVYQITDFNGSEDQGFTIKNSETGEEIANIDPDYLMSRYYWVRNKDNGIVEILESKSKKMKKLKESDEEKDKKNLLLDDQDEMENEDETHEDDLDIEAQSDDLVSLSSDDLDIESEETEEDLEIEPEVSIEQEEGDSQMVTMGDLEQAVSAILGKNNANTTAGINITDGFVNMPSEVIGNEDIESNVTDSEFAEVQDKVGVVNNKINNDSSYLDVLNGESKDIEHGLETLELDTDSVLNESGYEDSEELLEPELGSDELLTDDDLTIPEDSIEQNASIEYKGTPVKISITGWMITESEVKTLAEEVNKAGGKLYKLISPNSTKLDLFVEKANKKYKVEYVDKTKIENPTPWKVSNYKYASLKEAVSRLNANIDSQKERFFKKLVTESKDISNRNNQAFVRDADIFEGYMVQNTNSWSVRNAGLINLKTSINESYSNITQLDNNDNTLVKSKEGKFYLIKGNLKEASKKGTKVIIYENNNKQSYQVEVVGQFANTPKGMNKIMTETNRTQLTLLTWK